MNQIYLDNHATTPLDPEVLEGILPYLKEHFGNAASRTHAFGLRAAEAVSKARQQVASLIGARTKEIVFTSGATESDNLAITGAALANRRKGNHVITCVTEHKAVLDTCAYLESCGYEVTYLPVDGDGLVSPEQVEKAITDRTILVTIMHANNEIGTVHPIESIGVITRRRGVIFHVDAAQSLGKIPVNVGGQQGVDLMSVSAHKVYGPKGVGALYVRRGVQITPAMRGGGHEGGMRSGTLNVPGIVGLGKACEIAQGRLGSEAERLTKLRDRLHSGIVDKLDRVHTNGRRAERLPGNLNVSIEGVDGGELITLLTQSGLAISSGSACTSASLEPSYVLRALGMSAALANSSVRFGLGRFTTEEEIEATIETVVGVVKRLRGN